MAFHQILIPLDGSKRAEAALSRATALARLHGSRLHLVRVLDTQSSVAGPCPDSIDWKLRKRQIQNYMEALTRQPALQGLEVEWSLLEGRPAEQIIAFLAGHPIDLLVMSAHGHGGELDFAFGGTVQKVLSAATVSSILVRPDHTAPGSGETAIGRLLVPVDGSRHSEWAVGVAADLAGRAGAELLLLHVLPSAESPVRSEMPREESALRQKLAEFDRRSASAYLRRLARGVPAGVAVRSRLVTSRCTARSILESSEHEQVDLVVVFAREVDRHYGLTYPSVCHQVLAGSRRPVLMLREPAEAAVVHPGQARRVMTAPGLHQL